MVNPSPTTASSEKKDTENVTDDKEKLCYDRLKEIQNMISGKVGLKNDDKELKELEEYLNARINSMLENVKEFEKERSDNKFKSELKEKKQLFSRNGIDAFDSFQFDINIEDKGDIEEILHLCDDVITQVEKQLGESNSTLNSVESSKAETIKSGKRLRQNQDVELKGLKRKRQLVEGIIATQRRKELFGLENEGQTIAIDAHYHSQMDRKEYNSLLRQIGLCYSISRTVPKDLSLYVCGVTPEAVKQQGFPGAEKWSMHFYDGSIEELFPRESMVYLSPDARDVLETVDPGKVYVIGGLVDRTIAKNESFQRAETLGVACMRLPLAEYYPECHHRILNIDTILQILLTFIRTKDWRATFKQCIPHRKLEVVDANGKPFDYHSLRTQDDLDHVNESMIHRYQLKHALEIYCRKQGLIYSYENQEVSYDDYKREISEQDRKVPFYRFRSTVMVNGNPQGSGYGKSIRSAEARAAWHTLVALGDIKCSVCAKAIEEVIALLPSYDELRMDINNNIIK